MYFEKQFRLFILVLLKPSKTVQQKGLKGSPFKFQSLFGILIIVSIVLSSISLFYSLSNTKRIGYVDAVKLMSKYKGMELAKKELDERSSIWRANLDTLQSELNQSIEEYNRTKGTASARETKLLEQLVASRQQQLEAYQQATSEQFQQQDQEMSKKLLDKVNAFIKRYGEDNNYSLILSATPYGNIAYGEAAVDLTEKIVMGLNKEFEASGNK